MNNKAPPPQKVNFGTPPPDYVAGWGRGAVGFITRSDIGPSKMGEPNLFGAPPPGRDDDRGDYSETKFDNWLGFKDNALAPAAEFDEEDREAESTYSKIDDYMDSRRRNKREKQFKAEMDKFRKEKPTIQEQNKDAKRQLSKLKFEDWLSIPDAGDYSVKKVKRAEKYVPVPDKILDSARRDMATVNSISANDDISTSGQMTSLTELGGARSTVISVKLDRISDSVSGQSVVDPKGYLTSLNSKLPVVNSDADIGDWKSTRLLVKSAVETNPKQPSTWVAAARIEELDGKLQVARSFIAQGLQHCPDAEDLWLEAARLEPPEKAKSILAKAVTNLPHSVKIWKAAVIKENDNGLKKKILKRALEFNTRDLELWKQLIELGTEDEARELLEKAVKHLPNQLELWLAWAKLETYEKAKMVLNDARKSLPKEFSVWVAAAKLEEAQDNVANVEALIKRGIKVITKEGVTVNREDWLREAKLAEQAGYVATCNAIICETADIGVDEDDKEKVWLEDAENSVNDKTFATARSLYNHAMNVFSSNQTIYLKAIDFEKKYGDAETLSAVLEKALVGCPEHEVFWLMTAKHKWQTVGVNEAREVLARALEAHSRSENIYLAAAKLEKENLEFEKTKAILAAARENCNSAKVWMQSAQLERELGNQVQALEFVKEGITKYPNFAKLWMIGGQIEEKLGNINSAREFYTKGSNVNKNSVPLWICLVNLEANTGNIPLARSILEKAKLRNPNSNDLWYVAVKLEAMAGNASGAKFMLSKGLQECPKNGELWALAIEMEPKASRRAKTVEASKNCDNDPYVILEIAKLFWKEKKFDKAERWLERCVLVNGDYGDAWIYYYKFKVDRSTKNEAEEVLQRCKEADPHHGRFWISVAKQVENWSLGPQEIVVKAAEMIGNEFEVLE